MKTLTLILTDGPYISEYADMAHKIADAALKNYNVNIFLYMDALHIPKIGQNPALFQNSGNLFASLAERGVKIRACPRCGSARGYISNSTPSTPDYPDKIKITSLYDLQEMIANSDKVMALSR